MESSSGVHERRIPIKKLIIIDVISLVLGIIVTIVFCYLAFAIKLYTVGIVVALVGIAAIVCEIVAIRQKTLVKETEKEIEIESSIIDQKVV